jgi:hypothetical protein
MMAGQVLADGTDTFLIIMCLSFPIDHVLAATGSSMPVTLRCSIFGRTICDFRAPTPARRHRVVGGVGCSFSTPYHRVTLQTLLPHPRSSRTPIWDKSSVPDLSGSVAPPDIKLVTARHNSAPHPDSRVRRNVIDAEYDFSGRTTLRDHSTGEDITFSHIRG